jgi:sugar/nucleoside kinase (ribokinase family)
VTLNQTTGLSQRSYDVLAIGGASIDWVLRVEQLPKRGQNVIGQFVGRLPGGAVANFACAAARLGLGVASLSTVGDQQNGQLIVADFQAHGVATDLVVVRRDVETSFTVVLIEPSGERSIVIARMFEEQFTDDQLRNAIGRARALYTMPNDAQLFTRMGEIARANGVLTMIDVEATIGADRHALERILRWTDIASFNEEGLMAISGEEPTVEGARRLLAYGPHTIVVTLGARGALAVNADEMAMVPGYQPPVQDTTGAGDTFNAAFLAATVRPAILDTTSSGSISLARRLVFANAAAAMSTTGLGPRGCLPSSAEVEVFIAKHDGERP